MKLDLSDSLNSKIFSIILVILLSSSCNLRNKESKVIDKMNNGVAVYESSKKNNFQTKNDIANLQEIIKKLNSKKTKEGRAFFEYVDSITTYHCSCELQSRSDSFDIYAYISSNEVKNKIYHKFNLFTESEYLKNPQDYAILIRLQNDTIFVKGSNNYKYFNPIYEMGLASNKTAGQKEIPFLVFNSTLKTKWKIEDDLFLIDSMQTLSKMELEGTLIHHFKNFDYDTPSSHIPFIEEMYVSLEKGILGLKYDSGNYLTNVG